LDVNNDVKHPHDDKIAKKTTTNNQSRNTLLLCVSFGATEASLSAPWNPNPNPNPS
jgi:hypothetical protein